MARCALTIDIDAPVEHVWAISQDPARRPEWDFRVTEVRLVTSPPISKGSVLESRGWFGLTFAYQAECVTYEPPHKCAVRISHFRGMPIESGAGSWTYVPLHKGGCRFVSKLSMEPMAGWLGALLDRFWVAPLLRWASWRSLCALKRLAEAGDTASQSRGDARTKEGVAR